VGNVNINANHHIFISSIYCFNCRDVMVFIIFIMLDVNYGLMLVIDIMVCIGAVLNLVLYWS